MHPIPHISPITPIASTIFLPGDPLRMKLVAETYLEDVQQFSAVRNMLGYAGTYRDTPVFIMGSGTDVPLISLYTHGLIREFGCTHLVRVGTHGVLQPDVNLYDMVVAQTACSNSAFLDQYQIPGSYILIGLFHLIGDAVCRAREADMPIHVSNILSSDIFCDANPIFDEAWQRMGVLAVETGSAGLYATTAHAGVKTMGIFVVSGSLVTGGTTNAQMRQTSFTAMMKLALPSVQL